MTLAAPISASKEVEETKQEEADVMVLDDSDRLFGDQSDDELDSHFQIAGGQPSSDPNLSNKLQTNNLQDFPGTTMSEVNRTPEQVKKDQLSEVIPKEHLLKSTSELHEGLLRYLEMQVTGIND